MKEELQGKLLEQVGEIAEMTKEGLMKAVEIIQEQCPLLVEEILAWHFTISLLNFMVGPAILIVYFIFIKKMVAGNNRSYEKGADDWGFLWIIPIVMTPIISIVGMLNHLAWLKIWIAPRLFLMEYISKLIN